MARIRTIKPEFPHSASMGRVSRDARLTFVLLWTIADDAGRLRGSPALLAGLLFPYDLESGAVTPAHVGQWLDELAQVGSVVRYEVGGQPYVEICEWRKHQRIDHPTPSRLPSPAEGAASSPAGLVNNSREFRESLANISRAPRESLAKLSDGIGREGKGSGRDQDGTGMEEKQKAGAGAPTFPQGAVENRTGGEGVATWRQLAKLAYVVIREMPPTAPIADLEDAFTARARGLGLTGVDAAQAKRTFDDVYRRQGVRELRQRLGVPARRAS